MVAAGLVFSGGCDGLRVCLLEDGVCAQRGLGRGLVEERNDVLCAVLGLSVMFLGDRLREAYLAEESFEHFDGVLETIGAAIEDVCLMVELGRSLGS